MPNEFYIDNEISPWADTNAPALRSFLADQNGEDVIIRINSVGGDTAEGLAMMTYLVEYEGKVITQVDGVAYSMAAFIAQTGNERRMVENGILMLHGAQSMPEGTSAEDYRETADILDQHSEALACILRAKKITEASIQNWIFSKKDHFFTADEAKNAGLIDQIISPVDLIAALRGLPLNSPHPRFITNMIRQANLMTSDNKLIVSDSNNTEPDDNKGNNALDVHTITASSKKSFSDGQALGEEKENRRISDIRRVFQSSRHTGEMYDQLLEACISDRSVTKAKATELLIEMIGNEQSPGIVASANGPTPVFSFPGSGRSVQPGPDQSEKFVEGAIAAVQINASRRAMSANPEIREKERKERNQNPFLAMTMYELARHYLSLNGVNASMGSRADIVGQALVFPGQFVAAGSAGHGQSDFAYILANVAEKELLRGWDEAPETWREWARAGTNRNFKASSRPLLSTFADIGEVQPGGDFEYGTFDEVEEEIKLATFGRLYSISRQALVDDDLGALSEKPSKMGRAAARKVGDLAYSALISNPVLKQDSTTVFHADHNNIGTPGPIDNSPNGTLNEAYTAIATQKDPVGTTLNIRPRRLVVPVAMEMHAKNQMEAETFFEPTAAQQLPNQFIGKFTVTSDARLDDDSVTRWYLLSDQEQFDTVEVVFLNGQETPYMESKEGWNIDGIEYKVRIDAQAAPLDFRTMFKNDGAGVFTNEGA